MLEIGSGLDFTTTNVETTSPGLKVLGFLPSPIFIPGLILRAGRPGLCPWRNRSGFWGYKLRSAT